MTLTANRFDNNPIMKPARFLTVAAFLALTAPLALAGSLDDSPSSVKVEEQKVTISAKGDDVRSVLFDLFKQSGKNFVLDAGVRFVLYLNLEGVAFDDALKIVLDQSDLGYETREGVFYIGKNRGQTPAEKAPTTPVKDESKPPMQPEGKSESKTESKPDVKPVDPPKLPMPKSDQPLPGGTTTPPVKPAETSGNPSAKGKLTGQELQKRLTTRFSVTDIRKVFAEFAKQTGIKIVVDESVPAYKLDAFLIDTSLKYALDVITDAAKLDYTLTEDKSVRISVRKTAS